MTDAAGLRIEGNCREILAGIPRGLPLPLRGAAILAVLAEPPRRSDDPATQRARRRWSRLLIDWAGEEGRPWLERPQLLIPNDAALPLKDAQRGLVRLLAQVDRRLAAAHAMRHVFSESGAMQKTRGRSSKIGQAIRTLDDDATSLERLTEAGLRHISALPADINNFEQRVLRDSQPVLHLAYALAGEITVIERLLGAQRGDVISAHGALLPGEPPRVVYRGMLGDILFLPEMQERLLDQAQAMEGPVGKLSHRSPIVRTRLIEGPIASRTIIPFAWSEMTAASGRPTVTIPADATEMQVAVTLLSILAAPPLHRLDAAWRKRLAAFYRLLWDERLRNAPERGETLQNAVPAQIVMPLSEAKGLVALSLRDIDIRLRAAEALQPALRDLANGTAPAPPRGSLHWTLNEAIGRAMSRQRQRTHPASPDATSVPVIKRDIENFRERVLAPSRNVLHLAVSFAFALEMMERETGRTGHGPSQAQTRGGPQRFDWQHFCKDQARFARVALDVGGKLEGAVQQLPAGGPTEEEIVRLRHLA